MQSRVLLIIGAIIVAMLLISACDVQQPDGQIIPQQDSNLSPITGAATTGTGRIYGRIWRDDNLNLQKDAEEVWVKDGFWIATCGGTALSPSVFVNITNNNAPVQRWTNWVTVCDSSNNPTFDSGANLPLGMTYFVNATVPTGWKVVRVLPQAAGQNWLVPTGKDYAMGTLSSSFLTKEIWFGITDSGVVTGKVWLDSNGNGVWDTGEVFVKSNTATCSGGITLSTNVAIVTLPLGVFQVNSCDPDPYYLAKKTPGALTVRVGIPADYTITGITQLGNEPAWTENADNSVSGTLTLGQRKAIWFGIQQTVVAQPDLIVESININPAIPKVGDTVTYTVTVKNSGTASTGVGFNTRLSINLDGSDTAYDDTNNDKPTVALGANTNTFVFWSKPWTGTAGLRRVSVTVDSGNVIGESNEGNNILDKTFTVDPAAGCTSTSPDPAYGSSPISGTIVSGTAVILDWADITNWGVGCPTNTNVYRVKLGTTTIPPTTPVASPTLSTYTATGLLPATKYYWRVNPDNGAIENSGGSILNFVTPGNLTVSFTCVGTVKKAVLNWDAYPGGSSPFSYYFQNKSSSNPTWATGTSTTVTTTTIPTLGNGFAPNTNYDFLIRVNSDYWASAYAKNSGASCAACTSNAQCGGSTPVCDIPNGVCVECNVNSDCLSGQICTAHVCSTPACVPTVPSTEVCDGIDNDCNGNVDGGLSRSCYTGPAGTIGVGICHGGTQSCSLGSWGTCSGQVTPGTEICNGLDDNCNGQPDEGATICPSGQACVSGVCTNKCGNSVIDSGEQCDTGASRGPCPATCSLSCTLNSCANPCGNGILDAGEACDYSIAGSTCCSLSCSFLISGTLCRAQVDVCDVPETCSGTQSICPNDAKRIAGTECRSSAGACDPFESCTGGNSCPADVLSPAGTSCRIAADVCDLPETCLGSSAACPSDSFKPLNSVCRDSTEACDPAEVCSGSSATCPADTSCPVITCGNGIPDAGEPCDWSISGSICCSPTCTFKSATIVCRAPAGLCDQDELCSGASATCPTDIKYGSSTICRDSTQTCDPAERCDGSSNTCPIDSSTCGTCGNGVLDAGEACDNGVNNGVCPKTCSATCTLNTCGTCGNGILDSGEACDPGISGSSCCTASCTFKPALTICRDDADVCDAVEYCSGNAAACPSDGKVSAGTVCRGAAGECDAIDTCSGSSNSCLDLKLNSSNVCRVSIVACDPAEYCSGTSNSCPGDTYCGIVCGNGNLETGEDCDNGANNGLCPKTCSSSCTINTCTVCTTTPYCSNGNVFANNTACQPSLVQSCVNGCLNGACIGATCTLANYCVGNVVWRNNTDCTQSQVQTCSASQVCQSGACTNVACTPTGSNCGGTCPNKCPVGQGCSTPSDCVDGLVCSNQVCTIPSTDTSILLANPFFGVAQDSIFLFSVFTYQQADCRYYFSNRTFNLSTPMETLEVEPTEMLTRAGLTTGFEHRAPDLIELPNENQIEKVYVKCRFGATQYDKTFNLSFDTTPPQLNEAYFTPDIITELPLESKLTISASEDSFCRYTQEGLLYFDMEGDIMTAPLINGNNYKKSVNLTLPKPPVVFQNGNSYEYTIQCMNKALLLSDQFIATVSVNSELQPTITIVKPVNGSYSTSKNVQFIVTTTTSSNCTIRPQNGLAISPPSFKSISARHEAIVQILNDGKYNYTVKCGFVPGALIYPDREESVQFGVDGTAPTISSINTTQPGAPPRINRFTDRFSASWIANDDISGIRNYKVWIVNALNQTVKDAVETPNSNLQVTGLSLTNGSSYAFVVMAINNAGLNSTRTSEFVLVNTTGSGQTACFNSIKDSNEGGLDCGGVCPLKCSNGDSCTASSDCISNFCNQNHACTTPSCTDGSRNGEETDIDCGGGICGKCNVDKICSIDEDCKSSNCRSGTCDTEGNDNPDNPVIENPGGTTDTDKDGILDDADNCPNKSNPSQIDTDTDGEGDACDLDSDGDGMPDLWEKKYGLDPTQNDANKDPDNDGKTNLQEFSASTDPTSSKIEPEPEGGPSILTIVIWFLVLIFLVGVIVMGLLFFKGRNKPQEQQMEQPLFPETSTSPRVGTPQIAEQNLSPGQRSILRMHRLRRLQQRKEMFTPFDKYAEKQAPTPQQASLSKMEDPFRALQAITGSTASKPVETPKEVKEEKQKEEKAEKTVPDQKKKVARTTKREAGKTVVSALSTKDQVLQSVRDFALDKYSTKALSKKVLVNMLGSKALSSLDKRDIIDTLVSEKIISKSDAPQIYGKFKL